MKYPIILSFFCYLLYSCSSQPQEYNFSAQRQTLLPDKDSQSIKTDIHLLNDTAYHLYHFRKMYDYEKENHH